MPIPSLRSTGGQRSEFYCSACNTKFETQLSAPDMKAAIQNQWDEHLSSVHPRHWEREEKQRAERLASRERSITRRLVTIAFSIVGFLVACSYVFYLWLSHPHGNLRVMSIFDALCPPSRLTFVCIDVPCTTTDYARLWAVAAILNAGIYGIVGGLLALCVSQLRSLLKRTGVHF